MLTVQYAKGLSNMKVNCVDLGSTATDLNGGRGLQTVAVDFALLNLCQKGDVVVTQDYGVAAMIPWERCVWDSSVREILYESKY